MRVQWRMLSVWWAKSKWAWYTEKAKSLFNCNLVIQWPTVTRTNVTWVHEWCQWVCTIIAISQPTRCGTRISHVVSAASNLCNNQKPCAISLECFHRGCFSPTNWRIKACLKIIKPDLTLAILCVSKIKQEGKTSYKDCSRVLCSLITYKVLVETISGWLRGTGLSFQKKWNWSRTQQWPLCPAPIPTPILATLQSLARAPSSLQTLTSTLSSESSWFEHLFPRMYICNAVCSSACSWKSDTSRSLFNKPLCLRIIFLFAENLTSSTELRVGWITATH